MNYFALMTFTMYVEFGVLGNVHLGRRGRKLVPLTINLKWDPRSQSHSVIISGPESPNEEYIISSLRETLQGRPRV